MSYTLAQRAADQPRPTPLVNSPAYLEALEAVREAFTFEALAERSAYIQGLKDGHAGFQEWLKRRVAR